MGILRVSINLVFFISLVFGANYYKPNLTNLSAYSDESIDIPDSLIFIGIMVQFQKEVPDNPKTSGNGHFLLDTSSEYINFFDSDSIKCDGFLVDRPPHNSRYFQKQLEAAGNYYNNISNGSLKYAADIIFNSNSSIDGYYTLSKEMEYYAKSDNSLADLFTESLQLAKTDIENHRWEASSDKFIYVIFHAGLSQDFSYPSLDPTIYDLKSAYIDEKMMGDIQPINIFGRSINSGILLPETQNILYYDVVEDIFGNPDSGTSDLCDIQIGLTGIFTFLLGYELGLPEMFIPSDGTPGIGYFGLMDHGSNNGRGVIPAPPNPWTRTLETISWSNINTIDPVDRNNDTVSIAPFDSLNNVYKIKISNDEYFLIENRSNWVLDNIDIDSLRRKNKIDENIMGHWFDVVIDEFLPRGKLELDPETQVITKFDHYDYGLPGSGILIWHVKEPDLSIYSTGVNSILNYRHIQLEEADGAQDIGKEVFFPTWLFDPSIGTPFDFWYLGNKEYLRMNPSNKDIIFNNESNPSTLTIDGSESFLSIKVLSEISENMEVQILFNQNINIINLYNEPIQFLGYSYNVEDSTSNIFYEKENLIYRQNSNFDKFQIDSLEYVDGKMIYTYLDKVEYLEVGNCIHPNCEEQSLPMGYISSDDVLQVENSALSIGDIDLDGLDEIITIESGNIFVKNGNGTLLNGFPVIGQFSGVPLIANIVSSKDSYDLNEPEIICREGDDIVIISYKGNRLFDLSSYDNSQPLVLVPFFSSKSQIALIDGPRLFMFNLDLDNSYWLSHYGQTSGLMVPIGEYKDRAIFFRKNAYNYPNPISDDYTTFRFYIDNMQTSQVQVKIYNSAGYLVKDDLYNKNITAYEFNEIKWENMQLDAGFYLAEIKPDFGQSELIRMVYIK